MSINHIEYNGGSLSYFTPMGKIYARGKAKKLLLKHIKNALRYTSPRKKERVVKNFPWRRIKWAINRSLIASYNYYDRIGINFISISINRDNYGIYIPTKKYAKKEEKK